MPKKACCCKKPSCCNPILFEQFITLFGNTMQTAVPVNTSDYLVLRVNRPGNQARPSMIYSVRNQGQQCSIYCPN